MKKYKRILFLMMSFILLMGTVLPVSASELSEENVQDAEDTALLGEDIEDEDEPADDFDDIQEQEEYDEDEELTA